MGFYGREAASCSSMLIVLKAILVISYAIIQNYSFQLLLCLLTMLVLPSHKRVEPC